MPYYFQSVKGTTAEDSGIRIIPYLISITAGSLISGGVITAIGYYNPFAWLGTTLFAIGCGLLYTLKVDSSPGIWIGYQVITGFGAGTCMQIPFTAVQVVSDEKDMPVANAIAVFSNTLGGATSISITQNIFYNSLAKELAKRAPEVDAQRIIRAGATQLRALVPENLLPQVREAYLQGIVTAFILPIATACAAFLFSLLLEWKSVKGKKAAAGGDT